LKESTKKLIRKIGLVALIAFDICALAWSFYWALKTGEKFIWSTFYFTVGLNVIVIGAEIASVVLTGKTVSTNFKYWAQQYGWKAYVWLALFYGALIGLLVHWIPA